MEDNSINDTDLHRGSARPTDNSLHRLQVAEVSHKTPGARWWEPAMEGFLQITFDPQGIRNVFQFIPHESPTIYRTSLSERSGRDLKFLFCALFNQKVLFTDSLKILLLSKARERLVESISAKLQPKEIDITWKLEWDKISAAPDQIAIHVADEIHEQLRQIPFVFWIREAQGYTSNPVTSFYDNFGRLSDRCRTAFGSSIRDTDVLQATHIPFRHPFVTWAIQGHTDAPCHAYEDLFGTIRSKFSGHGIITERDISRKMKELFMHLESLRNRSLGNEDPLTTSRFSIESHRPPIPKRSMAKLVRFISCPQAFLSNMREASVLSLEDRRRRQSDRAGAQAI